MDLSLSTGQNDPNTAFAVEGAAAVDGSWSRVDATIAATPGTGNYQAEVPAGAQQSFYRVKRLPLSF